MLVQLALAQLTLVLFVCFAVTGRLSRWRLLWLGAPAAAGVILVLHAGAGRAAAGYATAGGELVRQLAGTGPFMPRLTRLPALLEAWQRWLPAQLPLALIVASAQAAAWHLLARRAAGAGTWYRPGAVVAVRRAYLTATLRRGEVATLDGGCVGVEPRTGKRAAISWQEACGGVLCTGQDSQAVTATGLELAVAAIQHRKAVIVVDLTASTGHLAIESAGADVGAPLRWFDAARGGYQPFAGVPADRGASLLAELIDWSGMAHARQVFCADYLSAALAVVAATTAGQDRLPAALLDEVVRLLGPGELRARLRQLPGGPQGGDSLGRRGADLAARLDADPEALVSVAAQLRSLGSTALGSRLRQPALTGPALTGPALTGPAPISPAVVGAFGRDWRSEVPGDSALSLAAALAGREIVVFALDRRAHGRPAAQVARLVVADLAGVLAERRELGIRDDCLVWINGCDVVGHRQLAALVALGPATGTCLVLGSTVGAVAAGLSDTVNVVALAGPAPADLPPEGAGDASLVPDPAVSAGPGLASQPGSRERLSFQEEGASGLGARLPLAQAADEVSLHVRSPRPRLVTRCRVVR
ncbi:MAG TPA: hypothetical protein VF834_04415 [Streptosporangiaceae bacterium]